MISNGWVVILGGSGYIGKALAVGLLIKGYRVAMTTRRLNNSVIIDEFKKKVSENELNRLLILKVEGITSANIEDIFFKLMGNYDVNIVINLMTSTTGSKQRIMNDNVTIAEHFLQLIRMIKNRWPLSLFYQVGSISEFAIHSYKSNYSRAKSLARTIINNSNLCDFYLTFGMTYGDNYRMVSDLRKHRKFLLKYPEMLFGFKMNCIHISVLVQRFIFFLESANIFTKKGGMRPFDVRILHEDLTLSQLLSLCFENECFEEKNHTRSSRWNRLLIFLHYFKFRLFSFDNPLKSRLALFCNLALLSNNIEKQNYLNHYLKLGDISLLNKNNPIHLDIGGTSKIIQKDRVIYIM